MPDPRELVASLYADFARDLADAARPIAANAFRSQITVEAKSDGSPVTEADRAIEQTLRQAIQRRYPDHGLIGEEFGATRPDAEWTWAIDPIDGTGAFTSGLPTFATLIALLHHGSPVLGLIDQPILQERWLGTVFDGIPPFAEFASPSGTHQIHTSSTSDPANAIGFATSPAMFRGDARTAWQRLSAALARVRYGIDAYAYGLLALGRIDLVCEASLKPWDYLALAPVIRAAGGVITDWQGQPLAANSGDQVLAAATRPLHRAALELLSTPAPAP